MNKRLSFVFAALMLVPVALLGQEKAPVQSTPAANLIDRERKRFLLVCERSGGRGGA